MARTIGRLSAVRVNTSPKGMHADGGGLYLHVNVAGARSWIFRFMLAGRPREMGLGPAHTIPLAEARKRATECRRKRLDGIDPIEDRKAGRQRAQLDAARMMTFKECAERYISAHKPGWKNPKHAAQWPATLATYAYPVFGALPVQDIDVGLVMKAVEPIWSTKTETASRVRGRIEVILDWATTRTYRQGDNPARWKGHLENLLPQTTKVRKVEHHAALPYGEIAAFVAGLRQQGGIAARALEFAILTAARTGEVIGARWEEFNLSEKTWIIPADRMKSGREHRVPLSPAALAIVESQGLDTPKDGFIFAGGRAGKPLSNMAMLALLRRMKRGEVTTHGFRSSFRDWAAESTTFQNEVIEMALAHVVSDKVEAAYRRGDLFAKRRRLMDSWSGYCVRPPVTGDV